MNGNSFRGQNSAFYSVLPLYLFGYQLLDREFALRSKFFPLRVDCFMEWFVIQGCKQEVTKVVFL